MRFWQKNLHEHKDGIIHSHDHNGLHTHDENGSAHDLPDFESMTKKAIDDWAKEINTGYGHNDGSRDCPYNSPISVDSNKTKANMIEEIKGQL